eukprot:1473155-Rhodomonas_salina.1
MFPARPTSQSPAPAAERGNVGRGPQTELGGGLEEVLEAAPAEALLARENHELQRVLKLRVGQDAARDVRVRVVDDLELPVDLWDHADGSNVTTAHRQVHAPATIAAIC